MVLYANNKIETNVTDKDLELVSGSCHITRDGRVVMVAFIGNDKYTLIGLDSGNRWCDPGSEESIVKELHKGGFSEIYRPIVITPNK